MNSDSMGPILLDVYLVITLVYVVMSFFPIYNLWRFGYRGDLTKAAIVVYILLSLITITFSLILIIFEQYGGK